MIIPALIIAVSKAYINPQKIVSNRATHNKIEYKNIRNDDIMSAKEKQAAAKQTFVFHAPLANEYAAKQDRKRDSANS